MPGGGCDEDVVPPSVRIEDLIICELARCFTDDDQAFNGMGSIWPVCAIRLAQLTHAPGLTWLASSFGLDAIPGPLSESSLDPALWRNATMYLDQSRLFWPLMGRPGLLRKFCVSVAQLDMYGNGNISAIGVGEGGPRVRLAGSAGLADIGTMDKQVIYWMPRHSTRSFVERVDFISCPGFLGGGDSRARLGLGGGPSLVISELAVMDFEPVSKRMRLRSAHPGVSVGDVQRATGFELLLPEGDVGETPVPTTTQLDLLDGVIDPAGVRFR